MKAALLRAVPRKRAKLDYGSVFSVAQMTCPWRLHRLLLLACLLAPAPAWGERMGMTKVFGHYQQRVWNEQDGLPQNSVYAITRTRDGYLWAGTVEGLVRFDGVRFTVFDTGNTPALRNNVVLALCEDRSGTLWIGTDGGGLTSLKNNHFAPYGTADGLGDLRITCLFEDGAGVLWVGTEGGGLYIFRDGRFEVARAAEAGTSPRVSAMALDAAGGLWVGTDAGLLRYAGGVWTTYTMREGLAQDRIRALYLAANNELWIGMDGSGVQRFANGRFYSEELDPRLREGRVWAISADALGALWFGFRGNGILRLTSDGKVSAFTQADGLPSDAVKFIYRDPEGSMWVGSEVGGLVQFAQGRFTAFTPEDGLPSEDARALLEDPAGRVWIGTGSGVSRWENRKFGPIDFDSGPELRRVGSFALDRAGTIWCESRLLGEEGRLYRFENGRFVADAMSEQLHGNQITTLSAARDDGLWIGTRYGGLHHRSAQGELRTYRKESGSLDDYVTKIFQDRSGALWIATAGRGMSRWKDERSTSWTTENGLTSNHVLAFYEDADGALWIGTHGGGLQRLKNGHLRAITRKDGLYDDLAFAIVEDLGGDFWMSCNKGIYRASRQELNDFADGKLAAVTSFSYGTEDGMLSRECNGATSAGLRTGDGRIWFPTIKGVVVVDPAQRSTQPPQLAIERLRIDGSETVAPVRISPQQETLEVEYTALSWQRPQQIRFRYRLAGLDRQWTDAGKRRTAYFSHLPPGNYAFEVVADNGEGVWAAQPTTVAITVLPPFWRTWWFLALCTSVLMVAIVGGFRWRDLQLQRRVAAQEEFSRRLMDAHESERRRVAAELHDSLGQSLAMIKNSALLGVKADDGAARTQLERITEQSAQAISEVREIAHNMRPYLLDRLGLTRALRSMFEKVSESSPLQLIAEVDEIDGRFPAEAEISLYRVIQESLNNILKHSGASEAKVFVRASDNAVRITIQDNGRGFDPDKSSSAKTDTGGFGLVGMAERVRLLGGTYAIVSAPGQGTTVTIDLPCAHNLQTATPRNGETPPHSPG